MHTSVFAFRLGVLAAIGGLLVQVGPALSIEAALKAPVGCSDSGQAVESRAPSCGDDISFVEAAARADQFATFQAACFEQHPNHPRKKSTLEAIFGAPCLASAMTETHVCGAEDTVGDYYVWSDLDSVMDGPKIWTSLSEKVRSGEVFDGGFQIVEARDSPPQEQRFALCKVRVIGAAHGPPTNCVTVAIVTPSRTLVRAEHSEGTGGCYVSASFRPGGSIDVSFDIQTAFPGERFQDAMGQMLRQTLGLVTEMEKTVSADGSVYSARFRATSGLRNSPILQGGWRESVDLDLWLNARGTGNVSVIGTLKPMVCRQASGRITDYHGPDDAQRATYASVVSQHISEAIKSVCSSATAPDDFTILCQ